MTDITISTTLRNLKRGDVEARATLFQLAELESRIAAGVPIDYEPAFHWLLNQTRTLLHQQLELIAAATEAAQVTQRHLRALRDA